MSKVKTPIQYLYQASLPISLIALVISLLVLFGQSSEKLAYVDVNKLVEGYERTKIERKSFEEKSMMLRANVDSLMVGWQDDLRKYEKDRVTMSKRELNLSKELLQNKQQQISNYQQAIQKQIQEEDQKTTQTIINDINDYVKEYGKRNGHRIVFGAMGSGNIMYAEEATDLTDEVLEGLNNQYFGR